MLLTQRCRKIATRLLLILIVVGASFLPTAIHAAGHGRWHGGGSGYSGRGRELPRGRTYYNGRYYGNFNNRFYGPQYGYF